MSARCVGVVERLLRGLPVATLNPSHARLDLVSPPVSDILVETTQRLTELCPGPRRVLDLQLLEGVVFRLRPPPAALGMVGVSPREFAQRFLVAFGEARVQVHVHVVEALVALAGFSGQEVSEPHLGEVVCVAVVLLPG